MDTLRTDRLLLRPVGAADGPFVVKGLNDLAVARWLAVVPYPYAAADFDEFLGGLAPAGHVWAIEEAGDFRGIVSIAAGKLGYWLMPDAHGRGLMTEAARAVLQAWFAAGADSAQSGYFAGNVPSARVLAKLGFRETARDQLFCRPLGQVLSHVAMHLPRAAFAAAG